jgi:bifunctional non-homologous end joining protein LigD
MATAKRKPKPPALENRALARYRARRDFSVTSEPPGRERKRKPQQSKTTLPFVVQKHATSRLHYDFRLGWNGVLKSWAVAKGPSDFPGDKRLAVQVEDHPWDYAGFEGTIPKGQYGGGAVMVWDTGDWAPLGDVDRGLRDGTLKFELHGTKLKGSWVLVRMHGQAAGKEKTNWLLIKEKDRYARDSADEPIVERAPNSVATGRTLEKIARENGNVWNSNRGNGGGKQAQRPHKMQALSIAGPSIRRTRKKAGIDLSSLSRERFPGFIAPQLAQQSTSPPSGSGWTHELKLDGYRIQIHLRPLTKRASNARRVRLLTRKGLDWTARMPGIAAAAAQLDADSAILDGEAVALDERGVSDFAALQAAFHEGREPSIVYFAFDLLHLNGRNLRDLPLSQRKQILGQLISDSDGDAPLRLSEDLQADGREVFKKACALGAEGIVSKLTTAGYSSGRGSSWLKIKCHLEQEFVVGGFTLPSKGNSGVGALLLGYYDRANLRYAGKTGTGFTQQTHRMLRARLDRLVRKEPPFSEVPREIVRGAHWVRPELVAQVTFSNWTRDNLVRQAAFKGLREDKPAREVAREQAIAPDSSKINTAGRKKRTMPRPQPKSKAPHTPMSLAITHPDKVLDEQSGTTKRRLAEYYLAVSDHLLPHIANRPLSIVRCPEGSNKPCFFQKHVGSGLPEGIKTVPIPSRSGGETEDYLTVDSREGLVGLAQMGVLEIHPWGAQNDALDLPDRIVFDLDPDAAIQWTALADAARELRNRLKEAGMESFLKGTGGKGLHIVAPIEPKHEWPAVKEFAHRLVLAMEEKKPDLYVTRMTKATRRNRIYLDYLRNDRGSTSVAPYSPRARAGLPVSIPLRWGELDAPDPPAFHVSDFDRWRSRLRHDRWKDFFDTRQSLPKIENSARLRRRSS